VEKSGGDQYLNGLSLMHNCSKQVFAENKRLPSIYRFEEGGHPGNKPLFHLKGSHGIAHGKGLENIKWNALL
jgi:hypothetical protein